jgi:hypothetical protein
MCGVQEGMCGVQVGIDRIQGRIFSIHEEKVEGQVAGNM